MAEDLLEAMEAFNMRELFGTPYAGGYMDQPVWWTEAIRCVVLAKHAAEEERKQGRKKQGFAATADEAQGLTPFEQEEFRPTQLRGA